MERRTLVAEIDERKPADQQSRRARQRPYDDGEVDRPQLKNLPTSSLADFGSFFDRDAQNLLEGALRTDGLHGSLVE